MKKTNDLKEMLQETEKEIERLLDNMKEYLNDDISSLLKKYDNLTDLAKMIKNEIAKDTLNELGE